jgi:hypothetical protein
MNVLAQEQLDELRSVSALDRVRITPTLLSLEPTPRSRLGDGIHAARATKHDFDFLHGSWNVHNRYLKERLKHSTDWIDFDARSDVEPLLNGLGQLDRYSAVRDGTRVEGITLRFAEEARGVADRARASLLSTRVIRPIAERGGDMLPA